MSIEIFQTKIYFASVDINNFGKEIAKLSKVNKDSDYKKDNYRMEDLKDGLKKKISERLSIKREDIFIRIKDVKKGDKKGVNILIKFPFSNKIYEDLNYKGSHIERFNNTFRYSNTYFSSV